MRLQTLLCLFILSGPLSAQSFQPSYNDLINETQIAAEDMDNAGFVWWLPTAYWELVMAESSTEKEIAAVTEVLSPYILIAAVDGKIGPFGGITYQSEEDLRASRRSTSSTPPERTTNR